MNLGTHQIVADSILLHEFAHCVSPQINYSGPSMPHAGFLSGALKNAHSVKIHVTRQLSDRNCGCFQEATLEPV